MIKKILRTLGVAAIFIGLGFGALIGFAFHANDKAEQAAKTFCGNIRTGSDIALAVRQADRDSVRYRVLNDKTAYEFIFQGWVFNAGVCRATVADGKVVSLHSQLEGD